MTETQRTQVGAQQLARLLSAARTSTRNSSSSPLRMGLARHRSSLRIIDFDDVAFGLSRICAAIMD
jgi:hypothetical protein